MKKVTIFLSVLFLLFVAGCEQSTSGEGESSAETEKKVVKIGAVPDSFPSAFKEDGELKGFTVDSARAIFDHIGYEIEWIITDWNGVLANLQSGKVDTATNFDATEERGKMYYFTDPYYISKTVVATSKDDDTMHKVEDISGKQIATIMGVNYENVLKENYPELDYELVTYETRDVVYTDVASGRVDGFVFGREQLSAQIEQRDIPLRIIGEPFGHQPVALPFQKTEENEALIAEINVAIAELKENGTFKEIFIEYFGEDITEK